ncbi:MAG TPA: hypothetical protein VM286_06285 [Candidatus Thermoplasmatota archaeon]|nr:hypothetical protein [Candidatus Thermoplasmatota archaeon]
MEPAIPFSAGPGSIAAAHALAAATLAYAIACGFHARRALRLKLADRWSTVGTTVCLAALAVALEVWGADLLPSPFGVTLLLLLVAGLLFTLLFTALRLQRIVERLKQALPLPPAPAMHHETRRKLPHLMMGFGLLFYVGAAHFLLLAIAGLHSLVAPPPSNLVAAGTAPWVWSGHLLSAWTLLAILFLLLPVELTRLRFPEADYPWKQIILPRLRSHEGGLMGAHIHMSAALSLCYVLLGHDLARWDAAVPATLAMLCVSVFADAASALFGIRWGRSKWPHSQGKSYIGSAAGTLVAFFVALPFVGAWGALAAAAVFLAMDLVGPIPLPVSDNLLNPLALTALFVAFPGLVHPVLPLL